MNKMTSVALVASSTLALAGCIDPDLWLYDEPPPPAVVQPAVVQPTVVQPTVVQPVSTGYVQPVYVYPNGGHSGSIRPPRYDYDDGYYHYGTHHSSRYKGHGSHHKDRHDKASSGPKVPDYAIRNRMQQQQKSQPQPAKPAIKSNSVSPTKSFSPSKPAAKPVSKPAAKPAPKPASKPPKNPPPKKK